MPDDTPQPRNAATILYEIGDGALLAELSREIHHTVQACERYALDAGNAGKGRVVLTLDFRAERNGTCAVLAAVTSKAPREKLAPSAMWVDPKTGNLIAENPRQKNLPFRDVNARTAAAAGEKDPTQ